ncbi:MAG: HD domain-containing protein [Clostridiales bacterium]|nr:HD domain-containing protein [Clostridiales bacterium]
MTFYLSIFILTELMMIAMVLHVAHYSGFTKTQKTWYLLTFIAIMLCSGAEFAVHCGYYVPSMKLFMTILTVLQFSIAPMLGILFVGALGLGKQKRIAVAFLAVNLVVETIAAPFGWVFYYTDEGYFRGNLFIIYEIFYFLSLIYLVVGMIVVGRKFKNRDARTIIMVIVVLVAGIVPMTLYQIHVTYIAVAISSIICYVYYNDLVQQDIQAELIANQEKMSGMQSHIITGLSSLIESRDMETGEHVSRTASYVKKIAKYARSEGVYSDQIDDHFISMLSMLAPMHDIGKIVVSDQILKKPARLTPEEFEMMKKHAESGGDVVKKVLDGLADEEYVLFASDIASYHHERWDGTGYPHGIAGEDIPLAARIMAIADVFDALISKRCYKEAIPREEAYKIIEEESGTHFDPKLVEVFLRHKEEF